MTTPPELYELLEWLEANPDGKKDDVPQPLIDYGWGVTGVATLEL